MDGKGKPFNPEGGFKPEVLKTLLENIDAETNKWSVWADQAMENLSETDKREILPHLQSLKEVLDKIEKQLL